MSHRRCLKPLEIDERRISKLVDECDAIEAEPHGPGKKERLAGAYRELARAINRAGENAKQAAG